MRSISGAVVIGGVGEKALHAHERQVLRALSVLRLDYAGDQIKQRARIYCRALPSTLIPAGR